MARARIWLISVSSVCFCACSPPSNDDARQVDGPPATVPITTEHIASSIPAQSDLETMPDLVGRMFDGLDWLVGLQRNGPIKTHWIANESVPAGVIFGQHPRAFSEFVEPAELWVSVGGPIVALRDLPSSDRQLATRLGITDDSEPIQAIDTPSGRAFKVDQYLFGADCGAVKQAYRTSIDPRYDDVCLSEPGRTCFMTSEMRVQCA